METIVMRWMRGLNERSLRTYGASKPSSYSKSIRYPGQLSEEPVKHGK